MNCKLQIALPFEFCYIYAPIVKAYFIQFKHILMSLVEESCFQLKISSVLLRTSDSVRADRITLTAITDGDFLPIIF